jgi:hypothetical protein
MLREVVLWCVWDLDVCCVCGVCVWSLCVESVCGVLSCSADCGDNTRNHDEQVNMTATLIHVSTNKAMHV